MNNRNTERADSGDQAITWQEKYLGRALNNSRLILFFWLILYSTLAVVFLLSVAFALDAERNVNSSLGFALRIAPAAFYFLLLPMRLVRRPEANK